MKKLAAMTAIVGVLALGGTAAAEDYPPGGTTATTAPSGGGTGQLPSTGNESSEALVVAGGALVAGLGLLGVTKLRRRQPA